MQMFMKLYPFDSSVGRAEDCSCSCTDILRSLVRLRLEGVFAKINASHKLQSYFDPRLNRLFSDRFV